MTKDTRTAGARAVEQTELIQRAKEAISHFADHVARTGRSGANHKDINLIRDLLAQLTEQSAALAAAEADRDDWRGRFEASDRALGRAVADYESAEADKARLDIFCEAHQPNNWQPDVYCPMCMAVQADNERIAAEARLSAAAQEIAALEKRWREREQALCRQADGQGQTQYAERLAAKADGIGTCADDLSALAARLKGEAK